ncbi:MAG: isoprenoid biosynthesis glyoxalase ElbB [Desulfuromonadales bacterium]|nr:isoprenoid biosynthesis glyoxalase ElbB [Desulfuromonadales bacterium]
MKKIGVILSGCGVYDGSEIHEAVITLLAIDRAGAEAVCMAPNVAQLHVVNHLSGEVEAGANRNVLVEAARIARGKIRDLATVSAGDLDAVILPGGFGAAKNLSTFALAGADCALNAEVERLLKEMFAAQKPIGALCIAPVVLARALGKVAPITVTIGNDAGTVAAIQATGAQHQDCPVREFIIDREHKIVSTPAYMLAGRISEAADGIEKTVRAVISLL